MAILLGSLAYAVRLLGDEPDAPDVFATVRAAASASWWIFAVTYLMPAGCLLDDDTASRGVLTSAVVAFAVAVEGRRWPRPPLSRWGVGVVAVLALGGIVGRATSSRVGIALVVGAASACS
jgi:hypothetical protein